MIGKRGISIVMGYVLLIVIAVAISGLVYSWMRFWVPTDDGAECPDSVVIVVKNLNCEGDSLNLTLENKGLFTIDGFILRVNNRSESQIGIYKIEDYVGDIRPGDVLDFPESSANYPVDDYYTISDFMGGEPTLVDVQPWIIGEDAQKLYCERVSSQSLDC